MGEEITLVIDDDQNPDNGNLYVGTGVAIPAPWNPDEPWVSFDLRPFDLLPGHYMFMFFEDLFQMGYVLDISITEIDPDLDLVTGVAEPFSEVLVIINWMEDSYFFTEANSTGVWTADYFGNTDIGFGDLVSVQQDDDLGGITYIRRLVVTPGGLVDEILNLPDDAISDGTKEQLDQES